MTYQSLPRIPGLNITVGSFLPRLQLPSLGGPKLAPADMVDEGELAVCVYNPAAVNPFPLPPSGVDLPKRFDELQARDVTLYVISGLEIGRLASWADMLGMTLHALSDAEGEFTSLAGIPIKQVEGRNFRTHVSFVLQEDRVLSILLETDPVNHFEQLLAALDVAEGREPGHYDLPDQPWYVRKEREACLQAIVDDENLLADYGED